MTPERSLNFKIASEGWEFEATHSLLKPDLLPANRAPAH
jgi:hypothetical protein